LNAAQKAELTLAIVISLAGAATILWGLWHALWGIYDHFMGLHKRRRNAAFDARVGRSL
jgi:hypothetical protein